MTAPSADEYSPAIPDATLARCGFAVHRCAAGSQRGCKETSSAESGRQRPQRTRGTVVSATRDQRMEFPPAAGVLRTSSATIGVAPQGRLVTNRSVPSLASKARPACEEPPRNWPQDRGTVETHCESPHCGAFTVTAAGAGTIDAFASGAACGFPALSATEAHARVTRVVTAAFQIKLFIVAPQKIPKRSVALDVRALHQRRLRRAEDFVAAMATPPMAHSRCALGKRTTVAAGRSRRSIAKYLPGRGRGYGGRRRRWRGSRQPWLLR